MSSEALLVAARALHFAAAIVLFGETAFVAMAAQVGALDTGAAADAAIARLRRRARRVTAAAWLMLVASGFAWLLLVAAQMAGAPLADALDRATLAAVVESTEFGRAWTVRAALALLWLGAWGATLSRGDDGPARLRRAARAARLAATAGLLAGLAWAGHANAGEGPAGAVQHAVDATHLLAAGLWLGGLAPLCFLLRSVRRAPAAQSLDLAARITARFGDVALASVVTLLVSGGANAWFLIASPRELIASEYGNVLLAKLIVFATMLSLAAPNRLRWTAALSSDANGPGGLAAARGLGRNAALEQLLAIVVLLLVAWLGVLPPPMRM